MSNMTDDYCNEFNDREEDIMDRGENLLVYDHNGKICKLKDSTEMYSFKGKYIAPKAIDPCDHFRLLFEKLFCKL